MKVAFSIAAAAGLLLLSGWRFAPAGQSPAPSNREAWLRGVPTGATRVVDMTWAINDHTPAWPGDDAGFSAKVVATPAKDGYFARAFSMPEHYGTHLDAPAHFPGGKLTLDQLPAAKFFAPAEVIDVRAEAARNPDYRLTAATVNQWEAAHGRIPAGAFVMLLTGWGSRWPDTKRYRNMDAKGTMHFPGYSIESARLLISRGVVGLGIDTLSIDYGPSPNFEVHRLDLPAGLYHLENLAHEEELPSTGAFMIAAPIKLEGGSGGPCRVYALLP